MPRLAFNTTADFFAGSATPTPLALKASVSGRLVWANPITTIMNGPPLLTAWLTVQTYVPVGFWRPGSWFVNGGLADQVAIPSGSAKRFLVIYADSITYHVQPNYHRANLTPFTPPNVPLPPNPIAGNGFALVTPGSPNIQIPDAALLAAIPVGASLFEVGGNVVIPPGATVIRNPVPGLPGTLDISANCLAPGGVTSILVL